MKYLFYVTFRAAFAVIMPDGSKYRQTWESEGMEGLAKLVMKKCELMNLSTICRLDICKYIKEDEVKKDDCSEIDERLPCLHHALSSDTPFCVAI